MIIVEHHPNHCHHHVDYLNHNQLHAGVHFRQIRGWQLTWLQVGRVVFCFKMCYRSEECFLLFLNVHKSRFYIKAHESQYLRSYSEKTCLYKVPPQPQNLCKITSQTTVAHSNVVFQPLLHKKNKNVFFLKSLSDLANLVELGKNLWCQPFSAGSLSRAVHHHRG